MNKDQILCACKDIIQQWGVQHLLMDEVSRRCGVSKKTIYEFFGSKECLLEQLGISFLEEEKANFQQGLVQQPLLVGKVRYLVGYLIDLYARIPFADMVYLKRKFYRNYEMLQEFLSILFDQLQELLKQGQQSGEFLPELQLDLHIHQLRAQLMYLHCHYPNTDYSLLQWRKHTIDTFLRSARV